VRRTVVWYAPETGRSFKTWRTTEATRVVRSRALTEGRRRWIFSFLNMLGAIEKWKWT
jgi:hypothetical protein